MEGSDFPRPLGATNVHDLQSVPATPIGGQASIIAPSDAMDRAHQAALPGIDPGEKKARRSSPDRQRAGEKLRGDVRVRVFDIIAKPGMVRVVLTGNRSGISVESESHGNGMMVMITLLRLWLRGAARLGK